MELAAVWFGLIAVLFAVFFLLEGFDYGVGILLPFLGKTDLERRMIIQAIGPVWDGNEVWMITAGGALFAAFPHVYATMFSSFYLVLFVLLLALIVRGVGFEYRSHEPGTTWRANWDRMIFLGSLIPALIWGIAITNLVKGLPINAKFHFVGSFADFISLYTVLGGLVFFSLFVFHGALFLSLKLEPGLAKRALKLAKCLSVWTGTLVVAFLLATYLYTDLWNSNIASLLFTFGVIGFIAACYFLGQRRSGFAFAGSALTIVFTTFAVFAGLFPRIIVSSLAPAWSLTIWNAASTPYTLKIMTAVALICVPVILVYQGWTYWVFRKRVTEQDLKY